MSENKYSVALGLYGKYLLRSPSGFVLGEYGIRSNAEHQADMLQTAYDAGRASALSEREGEVRKLRDACDELARAWGLMNVPATTPFEYAAVRVIVASKAIALTNGGAA